MLSSGYFKVHRELLPFFEKEPVLLYWYLQFLSRSYIADACFITNNQQMEIKRGQFLSSITAIAAETGASRRQLIRIVPQLEAMGLIVLERVQKMTLFTLAFYEAGSFQEIVPAQGAQTKRRRVTEVSQEKKANVKSPVTEMSHIPVTEVSHMMPLSCDRSVTVPVTEMSHLIRREGEEIRNEKIKREDTPPLVVTVPYSLVEERVQVEEKTEPPRAKSKRKPRVVSLVPSENNKKGLPFDVDNLARDWVGYAKEMLPWRDFDDADILNYGESLLKVMEGRGITIEGMHYILTFVRGDSFWCRNAISPKELLKKKTGKDLAKIDYILLAMRKSKDIKGQQAMQTASKLDMIEEKLGRSLTLDELIDMQMQNSN